MVSTLLSWLAAATNAPANVDLTEHALVQRFPLIAVVASLLFLAGIAADVYLLIRSLVIRFRGQVTPPSWGITEVLVAAAIVFGASIPVGLLVTGFSLTGLLATELVLRTGMLVALVEFFRRRHIDWQQAFGLFRPSAAGSGLLIYLAALPPLFVTMFAYERLLSWVGVKISTQPIAGMFVTTNSTAALILLVLFALVIAPVFEEIVFRGFAYPALKARFGAGNALLIVSVFFALMHAHLPSAGPLFVLSLALGFAYEYTGSIVTPITLHAVFNATNVATLFYVRANT